MTSLGLHGNRHDHVGPYACGMSREDRMRRHVSVGVTSIFTSCSGGQNKNVFPTPIIKCIHPQINQLKPKKEAKAPRLQLKNDHVGSMTLTVSPPPHQILQRQPGMACSSTPVLRGLSQGWGHTGRTQREKNSRQVSIQTDDRERSTSRRSNREHDSRNSLCKGPEAGGPWGNRKFTAPQGQRVPGA